MQREPFIGPVMELYHENEIEENLQILPRSRSQSTIAESLTGSKRSRESGVGSLADTDIDTDLKSEVVVDDIPFEDVKQELQTEVSQDSAICVSAIDDKSTDPIFTEDLVVPDEEGFLAPLVLSRPDICATIMSSEQGSPSPSLPKR